MSMRVIYIAVRAKNYSDMATRQVGRNIDKMIKQQQKLRQQMTRTFAAGIMFTAMAAMMGIAIGKIITSTTQGRVLMAQFGRAVTTATKALSEQFVKILGPTIRMVSGLLNTISRNEPIMRFIAYMTLMGTVLIGVKGIMFLLSFAISTLQMWWTSLTMTTATFTAYAGFSTVSVITLAGALQILQASMGPIIMAFMAGYMIVVGLRDNIPLLITVVGGLVAAFIILAAILWSCATAMSIISLGVAAAVGIGAIVAAHTAMPSYQYGTRLVQRTTPAIVHAGDVITRPDRGDYPSAALTGKPTMEVTKQNVTVAIGTVKTQADEEELRPLILKVLRDAFRNKR